MSVIDQIAFYRGIRDEVPNQELAKELAQSKNASGIQEIVDHLTDKNENVRSDCIKVLYEIGYLEPQLIAPYTADFIKLLTNRQNRLVWGGMIALSTVAPIKAELLFEQRERIIKTIDQGSVITMDAGIKALAIVAAKDERYQKEISPYLMAFLRRCRLSDVPKLAEFIFVCVDGKNREEFISILENRLPEMTSSQSARVKKLIRKLPSK